jgi:hypothetical protein
MKKIVLPLLVVLAVLFVLYKYLYKSHRDIANEEVLFTTTASVILDEFKKDEVAANSKYLDKTIIIYGKITALDLKEQSVTIDAILFGKLSDTESSLKINDSIRCKGRFIGYDELLEEIKMDQITLIK